MVSGEQKSDYESFVKLKKKIRELEEKLKVKPQFIKIEKTETIKTKIEPGEMAKKLEEE